MPDLTMPPNSSGGNSFRSEMRVRGYEESRDKTRSISRGYPPLETSKRSRFAGRVRSVSPLVPRSVGLSPRVAIGLQNTPSIGQGLRDELLIGEVERIHEQNYSVYGVRKIHAAMSHAINYH